MVVFRTLTALACDTTLPEVTNPPGEALPPPPPFPVVAPPLFPATPVPELGLGVELTLGGTAGVSALIDLPDRAATERPRTAANANPADIIIATTITASTKEYILVIIS